MSESEERASLARAVTELHVNHFNARGSCWICDEKWPCRTHLVLRALEQAWKSLDHQEPIAPAHTHRWCTDEDGVVHPCACGAPWPESAGQAQEVSR
jgi:hypothetical protein